MASVFEGKKIVLGVTGSIAAYKAAQVCSHLVKMGAIVYPVMTPNALNFLGISTLSALSGNETIYDQFREEKNRTISLAHSADVVVIAPATANTISKLATGICDNFLTTTALAATCPVLNSAGHE
ncbi:MAG: flavoprotein [Actinomycetota bacterium]|nr:flavoprotein [Actinomycetota bacterium]